MKAMSLISTGVLLLLMGSVAPTYAVQEHGQGDEQSKPEGQAKPERQQPEAKPARQEQAKPARQQQQPQAKAPQGQPQKQQQAKTTKRPAQQQAKAPQAQPQKQQQAKSIKQPQQQRQAASARPPHTQQEQASQRAQPALRLSARSSSRIPDARFQSNFGRGHEFHIGSPVMVGGYSRFQYGGYWFGFDQAWPVGWYYTDDVYVDYINGGYYLCNPAYPGVQVAINVVL